MVEEHIHNGHIIVKKKFGCAHCVETFDDRADAEEHIEENHGDLVPNRWA